MKKNNEDTILEEINRIKSLLENKKTNRVLDVYFEEKKQKTPILENVLERNKNLMSYDRKKSFLIESTESNKIHKMGNLLYPDEMYSISDEGEKLNNMGILAGQNNDISSQEGKKFKTYALRIATEKEWMTIFPYSMSKFFDPSFKRFPEIYKKWSGKTAKQAEDSMLVKVWKSNVSFKDFNIIDFTKTTDISEVPGFTLKDEKRRTKEEEKRQQEWLSHLESGKYKSVWENPEFVRNWSGQDDALIGSMFLGPLFYVEMAKRAIKKGYDVSPEWFKDWWENVAGPWISDYGWIPAIILGIGSAVALTLGAPVLAVGLGVAAVAIDVLEVVYYIQKDDPFMAGLCAIFLLIPGDVILRILGGKKLMRKAAKFLAEWCLGPGAKEGTRKMFKEAGEDLFGPIIEIVTNTKLLFKAARKMFRAKLVSLITKLRIKGLCKLIVWLISKGWLLVKFLLKTVFTMGTVAVTWIMLCKYFGIKLPWEGGSKETQVLNKYDTGKFISLFLEDLVKDNIILKKSEVGKYDDIRIKMIQLALEALGYDNILESDLSHLTYADRSYGVPSNDAEREKRCKTMLSLGDFTGINSDPACKKYETYFDPFKNGVKVKPNFNLSTQNTIKNIQKTKKEALGLNKDFGLKFSTQDKNTSTGLNYYQKPTSTGGLNLGFTPGTITPKLGYWDSEFDKMILVFQKRNNLKIEDDISVEFLTILQKKFKPISSNTIINYDFYKLNKEFSDYYKESGSAQKQMTLITSDELEKFILQNEKTADPRQDLYDSTLSGADNFTNSEDVTHALEQLDSLNFEMNKNDTLIKPIFIDWDTKDIDND